MKTSLFLICAWLICTARLEAGDAVAVAYNSEGVWITATYYCSSTPKGGADYKNAAEAREAALRDLRRRAGENVANAKVIAESDLTGHFVCARGKTKAGKDTLVVGYGKSEAEAEKKAFADLNRGGATSEQKVMYRYFSHGAD
jgi:hypothetical protein